MEESSLPSQDTTGSPHEVTNISSAPQCSESFGKNNDGASDEGDELMERGVKASKDQDYAEAVDCFSRALEIRVARYGELSPECVNAFYKYGCALLYKAQEEADPLGAMPKKDAKSVHDSDKDGSIKNAAAGETSAASASNTAVQEKALNEEASNGQDEADEGEESDDNDLGEGDEDESDLDLAWKMLDLARAIAEKDPRDTLEKVDILSALAEVAMEREDLETSLSDYHKALAILERLAEPDSRYIAELYPLRNFRICLCFEIGCRASEAIPYCQKATSICKSRVQRLTEEVKSKPENQSEKEAEIKTLSDLSPLTAILPLYQLEDLHQQVMNPTSILSDILGLVSAKAMKGDCSASLAPAASPSSAFGGSAKTEAPALSTAPPTNATPGVTNLGVVGRGVKRVTPTSCNGEPNSVKRPALEPSNDQGDGGNAA
ncbi:hypothetical protein V2J09_001978 [Rumex salicifolius]